MSEMWPGPLLSLSLLSLIVLLLLDVRYYYLPIHAIYLLLYVIILLSITIWISFVKLQELLREKGPLSAKYSYFFIDHFTRDHTNISKDNIWEEKIVLSKQNEPKLPLETESIEKVNADASLESFSNDIEKMFISKWYKNISNEETFLIETKNLLENVIQRVLQVSVQIDSNKLFWSFLSILLKHLKEFRKATKRVKKNGGSIENAYRYFHVGSKSEKSLQHYTHQLTANVLRELITWELWNSLPCRLLVSIFAKRFVTYLTHYVSQPGWLTYKIVTYNLSNEELDSLKLSGFVYLSLSNVTQKLNIETNKVNEDRTSNVDAKKLQPTETDPLSDLISYKLTLPVENSEIIKNETNKNENNQSYTPKMQRSEKCSPEKAIQINNSSINGNRNIKDDKHLLKVNRSEPVMIHSAKSTKRWDEVDCRNISVGQDILALDTLDGANIHGFSGRRLWGQSTIPEIGRETDKSLFCDAPESSFKEKDHLESVMEILNLSSKLKPKQKDAKFKQASPTANLPQCGKPPSTTSAVSFVTNTFKPTASTLHNMKEFQQSTVNNVVRPVSNFTEKSMHKIGDLQDEAVGVVEGIFDFGIAGIRKGLRLTGLQDNTVDVTPKLNAPIPISSNDANKNTSKLLKLHNIANDDLKIRKIMERTETEWVNPISKDSDTTDFENEILLEKFPCDIDSINDLAASDLIDSSPDPDKFLNDSPEYEETADLASTISKLRSLLQQKSSESSFITPAISPLLPIEDKSCSTPVDPINQDETKVDRGMQKFARTVTGMFNTIKTALPGNMNEQQTKNDHWIFVENETSDTGISSLLNSLLIERRDYCTVDPAYEAMDSDILMAELINPERKNEFYTNIYEDEIDDMGSQIPISNTLLDIICECLQDTNTSLTQEFVMKLLLILTGSSMETYLSKYANKLLNSVNKAVGPIPTYTNDLVKAMSLEEAVDILQKTMPSTLQGLFHDDLKVALTFFLSSLQFKKINEDIVLQLLELISSQLINMCNRMSPTASA